MSAEATAGLINMAYCAAGSCIGVWIGSKLSLRKAAKRLNEVSSEMDRRELDMLRHLLLVIRMKGGQDGN